MGDIENRPRTAIQLKSVNNFRHLLDELPASLQSLAESVSVLALDLRWTWSHEGDAVWARIDPELWEKTENPLLVQQNMTRARLEKLEQDTELKQQLKRLLATYEQYCERPGWFGETYPQSALKKVAYFSMEYGLHDLLKIFCGGLGTRLREHSDTIPKPLVNIGYRPIIWHLMRYYAYHGHKDFVLCLGYRGDLIRKFFLEYNECMSNDFVMSDGGNKIELLGSDIDDWRITFVDTGLHANIGERLVAVRRFVEDEDVFLANYSDGLSDLPLNTIIESYSNHDAIASFVAVRSAQSFHSVRVDATGQVAGFGPIDHSGLWINGGYFVLGKKIFDYVEPGEELVVKPFQRLIAEKKLSAVKYDGFWQSMDTFKDKITFDRMYARGERPWEK